MLRIDAISKQLNEIRQGFIAMSFSEETDTIRKAFRQAIQESGYTARVIDEKDTIIRLSRKYFLKSKEANLWLWM